MREIAPSLQLIDGHPRYTFNVYLMGDVLIDSATRYAAKRILKQTAGINIAALALTHGHADHQGAAHRIATELCIPLWCAEGDKEAVEKGDIRSLLPPHWSSAISTKLWAGPGHPVAKVLSEGDEVAGFTVIETPGHSPGHVSFYRASDGVVVLGDVIFNIHPFLGTPGTHQPPDIFTVDPTSNRASARKIAALNPELVCFGHGKPLSGEVFQEFVENF